MTTPQRLSADNTRLALLQDCENKIKSAFRRGLEATCDIANELNQIFREELYEERGFAEFGAYVTNFLQIDPRTFRRILDISETVKQLKGAGLALPENESQVAELSRLAADERLDVWKSILASHDPEVTMTARDVRRAVETTPRPTPSPPSPPPARGGIEVDMDVDMDNGDEPPEKPAKGKVIPPVTGLVLTEKGEAALARIRRLCGEEVAQGIESGATAISERELRNWADQPDHIVKALPHYVTNSTWSVSKAIAFETAPIRGDTDANDMVMIARARGGSAVLTYENAKISIVLESV